MSGRVLADTVEWKRGLWAQTRGLMGRKQASADTAYVFPQPRAFRVPIWMLGVRTPLCVVWVVDERVTQVRVLPAWHGVGIAKADTVVELHPRHQWTVKAGDRLTVVDGRLIHERPSSPPAEI